MKFNSAGSSLRWDPLAAVDGPLVLGQIYQINGPEVLVEPIDVTTHDSTGGFREKKAGLGNLGDITIEYWFDANESHTTPAGLHGILEREAKARTVQQWEIEFKDGTTNTWRRFNAIVKRWSPILDIDGPQRCSVTLEGSGEVTSGTTT